MTSVDLFAQAAEATGYRREALVRDYAFADVLADGGTRSVCAQAKERSLTLLTADGDMQRIADADPEVVLLSI